MRRRTSRRGFTLVELLVVIAIIGTLVALLLPAVQSAREAARRMSCQNNLHNIVIALQNYHDVLSCFPPGYTYRIGVPTTGGNMQQVPPPDFTEMWGWSAFLLPFLEQKNLSDLVGVDGDTLSNRIAQRPAVVIPGIQTPLKIFMCPSDSGFNGRGLVTNNRSFNGGLGFTAAGLTGAANTLVAVSNYPGIAGHIDGVNNTANTGIFWGDSYVRMADIVDGTSNTFIVGERETLDCNSGTWVGTRRPAGGGTAGVNVLIGHSRPKLNQPTSVIAWNVDRTGCAEGFSSLHPNGAQFALCDGSVRFVSNNISHNWFGTTAAGTIADSKSPANGTYQRLFTRNDKLGVPDL